MDKSKLAAGAVLGVILGGVLGGVTVAGASAATQTVTVIFNQPSVRTRAEACTLLVSLVRSPDPFTDKSATAVWAQKLARQMASRGQPVVCAKGKGDPPIVADGSQHFGPMVDGKPEGFGVRFYSDGSRYIGEWKAGLRQGEGMGLQANGARYVGHWEADKPHGKGVLQYHAKIDMNVAEPDKPAAH